MFDELSEKVSGVFTKLRGRGVLSDSDIKDGLREMRRVLLEADVSFQLTREFLERSSRRQSAFRRSRPSHPPSSWSRSSTTSSPRWAERREG
jgi:signal recognition particle subunit SRP54